MFEYVGEKPRHGKIDKNWVFFEKGKEYSEVQRNYAVSRGVREQDFVLKSVAKEVKVEVKKEEPIVEVKRVVSKKLVRE